MWIPGNIQDLEDGSSLARFPYPNPIDLALNPGISLNTGFQANLGDYDDEFKRILALDGDLALNLSEIGKGLFVPSENPAGYLLVERSRKVLRFETKFMEGVQPGYFAIRHFQNLSKMGELSNNIEVPIKGSDFLKWSPGDLVIFRKTGPLFFNLGYASKKILDFGISGSLNSTWEVQVLRLPAPEKKLMVRLNYKRFPNAAFSGDFGQFSEKVNLIRFWGKSQKFSFEFDLSNQKTIPSIRVKTGTSEMTYNNVNAQAAYEAALKGNFVLANLLYQSKGMGVQKIFDEDYEGSIKSQKLLEKPNVPFKFEPISGNGQPVMILKAKVFPGNVLLENVLSNIFSHIKELEFGEVKKEFLFYFQQITPLDEGNGNSFRRFSATFKGIRFIKESYRQQFFLELESFLLGSGFDGKIFNPNMTVDIIKNLNLKIEIKLSSTAMDVLMNLPDEYPENVLINHANEFIGEHFKKIIDVNQEVCQEVRTKNFSQCVFQVRKNTYQAMGNAIKSLRKMKASKNLGNYVEFLRSLSEFGASFIENRFVIGTFLKFIHSQYDPHLPYTQRFENPRIVVVGGKKTKIPSILTFEIKGENISPYSKTLRN